MPVRPVAIYTLRNGEPYVLFGAHLGAASPHGDSGMTFAEVTALDGSAPVTMFEVEDGPDIAKWEKLFSEMEREGVTMLVPDLDPDDDPEEA
jgi:hypothetical protein